MKEGITRLRVFSRPGIRYLWLTPAATNDNIDEGIVRFDLEDAYRMATAAADVALPLPAPPLPLARSLPPPPPPSLDEQANTVGAEISRLNAEREAHLEAAQELEEDLRPLQRRLQYINHQRMMAAWGGVRPQSEATTGPTHACEQAVCRRVW